MSDDPTEWFRPRGKDGTQPEGGDATPPTERIDGAGTSDGGPATQPLGPGDRGDDAWQQPTDAGAAPDDAAGGDGLDDLFGAQQRDYSEESDWLPPRAPDAPTEVQPTAPASDPLDWLGTGSADDATTVALGAGAAGVGAGAAAAASAGGAGAQVPADAVTQRFDAAGLPPTGPGNGGGLPPEEGGSKKLVIALAVVGGVLVIAIIVALVVLLGGTGSKDASPSPTTTTGSKSPSPTPSRSTPSATPTPTPTPSDTPTTPPVPAPAIGSFSASPSTPACTAASGSVNVSFSWSTSNAAKVSLSIDGVADPYNDQLSASGTLGGVPYDCSKASQGYTLIATNSKGQQTSKPLTLTRPSIPTPTPTATTVPNGDDND